MSCVSHEPLDLRRLQCFVALAADGHFGRAAARCFISRPAFSQQIIALERHLGVSLVLRSASGVRLTPAGDELLEPARALLRDARRIELAAARSTRAAAGEFVLGYCDHVATTTMPEIAGAIRSAAPGVTLSLIGYPWWTQAMEGLVGGECDAAIGGRVAEDAPGTRSMPIASERLVAIVPDGHVLAGGTDVSLLRLSQEPFAAVARERSPAEFDALMALFDAYAARPTLAFRPHRLQDALAWVGLGSGVSVVPETLVRRTNPYAVEVVPLADPVDELETVLSWSPDRGNPLLELVRDVAEEVAARA